MISCEALDDFDWPGHGIELTHSQCSTLASKHGQHRGTSYEVLPWWTEISWCAHSTVIVRSLVEGTAYIELAVVAQ